MIRHNESKIVAAALLALAVVIAGCSRKTDNAAASDSGANPPGGEQSESAKQSSRDHGRQGSEKARGGEKAKEGWGDQGQTKDSGPAYATDRFSKQDAAPQAHNYTLDAGSPIVVRTINTLSTKTSKAGDRFEATLERPLVVGDYTVAPKGTSVFGEVTMSDPSGKLKGSSTLGVRLTAIAMPNGDRIAIQTQTDNKTSQGTGKKTAAKVGIGAGIGALIGAIAGGGKGAAIGAGAGGAAGGGYAYATGGNPAVIASETVLTFQLAAPVTVTSRD